MNQVFSNKDNKPTVIRKTTLTLKEKGTPKIMHTYVDMINGIATDNQVREISLSFLKGIGALS